MINKRRLNILILILDVRNIEVIELSKIFNVSVRTIHDDFKVICEFTFKYWNFILKNSNGVISCDDAINLSKSTLFGVLSFENYYLDKEERLLIEFLILSTTVDYITYTKISDIMLVSRSTIAEDQHQFKELLKRFDVELMSKSGYGVRINGIENNIRKLFNIIVYEYIYLIYIYFNSKYYKNFKDELEIDDHLQLIQNVIRKVELNNKLIFNDMSIMEIVYFLDYWIIRQYIGQPLDQIEKYKNYSSLSLDIYEELISQLNLESSDNEVHFIDSYVRHLSYKKINTDDEVEPSIQILTRKVIDNLSELLRLPLYLDYKLFESLSMHIDRINNQPIYKINNYSININTYINDNKFANQVFEAVIIAKTILEKAFNRKISNPEINFIVIYVCASIERIKSMKARELSITVICNYGIGTSEFIKLQLLERFSFKYIEIISSHQLDTLEIKDSVILISTINLNIEESNYIKVEPILTTEDFDNISNEILEKLRMDYYDIDKNSFSYIDILTETRINKGIKDFLTSEFITIVDGVVDWKDSIKIASEPLLIKGYIDGLYVEKMINNVIDNGPYIVVSEGVAIPHADKSLGVKRTSFSLLKINEPVYYNAGELDPVKYVCVLAVNENEDHTQALFELVNLFRIDGFKDLLNEAQTSYEIEEAIHNFCDF